jgi:hypothetical protein
LIYLQLQNNKAKDKIPTQRAGHKVNRQNHSTQIRNRKKTPTNIVTILKHAREKVEFEDVNWI